MNTTTMDLPIMGTVTTDPIPLTASRSSTYPRHTSWNHFDQRKLEGLFIALHVPAKKRLDHVEALGGRVMTIPKQEE
jgi:hypothetical protein